MNINPAFPTFMHINLALPRALLGSIHFKGKLVALHKGHVTENIQEREKSPTQKRI